MSRRRHDKTRAEKRREARDAKLPYDRVCPRCGAGPLLSSRAWVVAEDGTARCKKCHYSKLGSHMTSAAGLRILMVAERYNMPLDTRLESMARMSVHQWVDFSLSLTALAGGHARAKLSDIGVPSDVLSMNLLPPAPQGTEWDARLARSVAEVVALRDYDAVMLVGRRVATAFGCPRWPMLHSARLMTPGGGSEGLRAMLVPHPSGLNHFWNDEIEVEVARELVTEWICGLKT